MAKKKYVGDSRLRELLSLLYIEFSKKVNKETGKGLSTQDYTNADKAAVQTIANKANDEAPNENYVISNHQVNYSTDSTPTTINSFITKLRTLVINVMDDIKTWLNAEIDFNYPALGTDHKFNMGVITQSSISDFSDAVEDALDEVARGFNDHADWVATKADKTEISGSKSINGNPIAISDAANAYAEEVIANIEPIQDLHGYDHPWVGGAGKNLIPMTVEGIKAANTSGTWSGNVYTFSGGTFTILTDNDGNVTGIKINGTFSGQPSFILGYVDFYAGNTYLLNGAVFNESRFRIAIMTIGSDYGSGYTYTPTADDLRREVLIYCNSNPTADNLIFKPMIRLSTETDASFTPYSNICPISGLDSVEVKRIGKNLFGEIGKTENYFLNSNGVATASANWNYTDYIPITGDSITMSYNAVEVGYAPSICFYDEYKNFISGFQYYNVKNKTVNIPMNAKYFRASYFNTWVSTFQIELGSTATDFEPYTAETHTTSLPQTTYGGTLNVQTGELVIDRGIIIVDGSETFYIAVQNDNYITFRTDSRASEIRKFDYIWNNPTGYFLNNMFIGTDKHGDNVYYARTADFAFSTTDGCIYLCVPKLLAADVTSFKAFLSANNFQLVRVLITPQTYQLTPSQVKLLLNHNNISTNADTLDIVYQVNNVLGEILGESEEYTDIYVQKRLSVVERELYCQDGYYGIEWNIDNLMELVRAKRFMDFATGDFVVDNDVIWEITQKMPYSYYNLKDSNKANLSPHISLCPREIIGTQQYNTTNTNTGGYGGSLMPARMETEYEKLGTDLKSYVATIRHLDNNKGTWAWTERQMFLPSIVELTGNKGFADGYSGFASSQHKLFAGGGMHRIKSSWYWTADPSGANTTSFCFLSSDGNSSYYSASNALGLAPLIVLK